MSGGTQGGAAVHWSPQALGAQFNIESNDYPGNVTRIFVTAVGTHKLTATGIRAILSRLNTYLGSTLSAAQVDSILTVLTSVKISPTRVDFYCVTSDRPTLVSGLVSDIQGAGAFVNS